MDAGIGAKATVLDCMGGDGEGNCASTAHSPQPIHFEVHIRNAEGEHLKTTIDGEVVEGASPI